MSSTSTNAAIDTVAAIADAVSLPLIVDADTGFGNAVNTVRAVRVLERSGAAGIQIEDQVFPKKCGHFAGKGVIALDAMLGKIKAAVDTRRDGELQIIARTDARAVEGLDRAIERAHAFVEAGADMIFIEAPLSSAELARIASAHARDPDPRPGIRAAIGRRPNRWPPPSACRNSARRRCGVPR